MENIIERLAWRYACKRFDPNEKLSSDQIAQLKEAFNLTATSFGLQPIKMMVIENADLKKELQAHAFHQAQITTCSHLLVICIEKEFGSAQIDAKFDLEKSTRGTSEEIVGKFRGQLKDMFAKKSEDQIRKESMYQAYIALGNLMTVCAVLGIDSCPMEGFIPNEFDKTLGLHERGLSSVLLLPVGKRSADDAMQHLKKIRKPLTETVIDID